MKPVAPRPVRAWVAVLDKHGSTQGDSRGLPVLYSTPKEAEAAGTPALVYIVPGPEGVMYWCVRCPEQFLDEGAAIEHFRKDGHGFSNNIHHGFLKRDR